MKSNRTEPPVVSAEWLKTHLRDDGLRIVDASWHLPAAARDAHADFRNGHIPGAVFFDLDEHSARSALPHMLPDAEQFSRSAGSLGIAEHHVIVVYDTVGLFSAARVWWMFRHFGATHVYVLDGGLPAWQRSGGEVTSVSGTSSDSAKGRKLPSARFNVSTSVQERQEEVADVATVRRAMSDKNYVIMDARPASRFSGVEKEARPGLRSGHIPGSINIPLTRVLNHEGTLRSLDELEKLFGSLQLHDDLRVVTTCGSGVTAAVLCLALACVDHDDVALYDGSWSEWGALADSPVATGAD